MDGCNTIVSSIFRGELLVSERVGVSFLFDLVAWLWCLISLILVNEQHDDKF